MQQINVADIRAAGSEAESNAITTRLNLQSPWLGSDEQGDVSRATGLLVRFENLGRWLVRGGHRSVQSHQLSRCQRHCEVVSEFD